MEKVYEAYGEDKEYLIDLLNECDGFDSRRHIKIKNLVMVGRISEIPNNYDVDIKWSINTLKSKKEENDDIIVIEPLIEQIYNESLQSIDAINTTFSKPIKLSSKAIFLMPIEKYKELCKDTNMKHFLKGLDIRSYEGEEALAFKLLLKNKSYIFLDSDEQGYTVDDENFPDLILYIEGVVELVNTLNRHINSTDKISKPHVFHINRNIPNIYEENCKAITGLTKEVEGNVSIDDDLYATTDIGKSRENQEDAILLVKDKNNPKFKMMVLADGVGGYTKGEIASHVIIEGLKEWFENLSTQTKEEAFENIAILQNRLQVEIENTLQARVMDSTDFYGASTLVCAIIGKNDTLVSNVGDSRAYITTREGQIVQISREDTVVQEKIEKGEIPNKEVARFDEESNQISQCLGMNKRGLKHPHFQVIDNNDYDMLLLFSDGVTDCLSDEDIAVVCRNTDKKKLTEKIVEKAIRHDSIRPTEYEDYIHLHSIIPGGKDNTTAVAYIPHKEDDLEK